MTASMTWCVIYTIKVNYTSYNYTSDKSTWMSFLMKSPYFDSFVSTNLYFP